MEAIMRAYIVIGTLAVLALSARIYTAHTQDRLIAGLNCTVDCSGYDAGYNWAKQRDIDDDDYCDGEDAPACCVTLDAAPIRIASNNGGAESPKG